MRRSTSSLLCASVAALSLAACARGDEPAAKAAKRFDPSVIPEPSVAAPTVGLRYASLSKSETRALRRGFKLSLDALASADSVAKLRSTASVSPLPDPNQPMIAVAADATAPHGDPFGQDPTLTSFRDDPMRALGERLGASDEDASVEFQPAGGADDPFAASADDDPFSNAEPASTDSGEDPSAEDPFADDGDPFGDDPFGF